MPIDSRQFGYPDISWEKPVERFSRSALYRDWRNATQETNNDYLAVVAAGSRSRVSGTGKTTLGGNDLARHWDRSEEGYIARKKATLNASQFAKGMMASPENVPNHSAVVFDEAQGTLSGVGADARRSMQQSVMEVATAIATMRMRQLTGIIIAQSPDWIDQRIDELLDALILIQDRQPGEPPKASVYETYYNDFEQSSKRYTERMCEITWEPVPYGDADYNYLHRLKESTAQQSRVEADEDEELSDEVQKKLAQEMRDNGATLKEIASSDLIEYSKSWVGDHTEAPE